jgi:RNA polymerase sigma factor (TIGR02999 family)
VEDSPSQVTKLLLEWSHGDSEALEKLIPLIYRELRQIAQQCLNREHRDFTLQSTALVQWKDRSHFFAVAAQLMRRILVDHARARNSLKRGGNRLTLALDEAIALPQQRSVDLALLDDALNSLATLDARQSRIVELRFFAGLSVEDTSQVIGISPATVKREWSTARAWLLNEMMRKAPI